jgi:phosphoglycolate phosphatase
MSLHPWIILFDIDGTLLTVDRNFNRPLLRSIIDELDIDYPEMEKDPFSGRTDHDIITSFLVRHDNQEELYRAFKARYLEQLSEQIQAHHVLRHAQLYTGATHRKLS